MNLKYIIIDLIFEICNDRYNIKGKWREMK
ncbi:hypothetical protein METP3_01787 [Methanosarcinales archaeon]|nr:hypothetical protein METP3_01787 [Methanosarcinales archaeon]